ncbi:geranylgeranyl pyrophosphate synthetase [Sorochytrium milnesiophthora]
MSTTLMAGSKRLFDEAVVDAKVDARLQALQALRAREISGSVLFMAPPTDPVLVAPADRSHRDRAVASDKNKKPRPSSVAIAGQTGAESVVIPAAAMSLPSPPDNNDCDEDQPMPNASDAQHQPLTDYENDEILLAPYLYLLQNPGKGIRSAIFNAFNVWLKVPEEKLKIINNVVEMLHGGSLLIDDIEDGSALRRGVPVAHKIYGTPQTINCANYVYFIALQEVQKLQYNEPRAPPSTVPAAGQRQKTGPERAVEIFTEELMNAHRGQGVEIFWRENMACPTEEQYLEMVGNKTSALLRLGISLMVEFRSVPECPPILTYTHLCTTLGNLFQIRDDYINLVSAKFSESKGYCEDFEEGKFSFPVIHSVRATPHDRQLLNILKQRTTDVNLKKYALQLLDRTNSLEYTQSYLKHLEADVRTQVAAMRGNPALIKILELLRKDYSNDTK